MKKKYLVLCFFLITSIFLYSQEVERPVLKLESQIRLLALNSQFEKADILVKENFALNSYEYYFYLGYIQEAKRNYRDAIKNYNEAYKIKYTREVAMALLRNYIDTKAYKRASSLLIEITNKDEKIAESQRFQDLKKILADVDAKNQEMGVSLKLSYNDNLDNVKKDKTNNLFTSFDFYFVKVKDINEKISTNNYFVYLNETNFEESKKNSHTFYLGTTIELDKISYKLYFPIEYDYTIEDNKGQGYNLGAGIGFRKLYNLRYLADLKTVLKYDSDLKGTLSQNSATVSFKEPFGLDYRLRLNLNIENYDESAYSLGVLGYDLRFRKLMGNNTLSFRMKLDYETYKEGSRKNLIEEYILAYEKAINNKDTILAEYKFKNFDSNESAYEYSTSTISLGFSRRF